MPVSRICLISVMKFKDPVKDTQPKGKFESRKLQVINLNFKFYR